MIDVPRMLLVADEAVGSRLEDQLGRVGYVRCGDPYDALLEMGRRSWPSIVLTAPRPDFAGLARASRRLQQDARVFGLCPPAAEPNVRLLAGDVLDDYFIYPPTDSELRCMLEAIPESEAVSSTGIAGPDTALSGRQYAEMLQASQTLSGMESHIAAAVSRRCGTPTQWMDADSAATEIKPLLLAAGDVPRVLVPTKPLGLWDENLRGFIAVVQDFLPALVATARRTESLHRLAITDHLTGAHNRRYFYHMTDKILSHGEAEFFRATLLLFDIDDFKRYNDTYGHAVGDEILREIARLIRRTTRNQDIVARIGGDEFAVLFWETDQPRQPDSRLPEDAYIMAERFRQAVVRHEFPSLGPEARGTLTVSGGLATYPADGLNCRELLRTADGAMRSVKQTGKNAIRLIGS